MDYILTPHNCLESCVDLKVITSTDLMDKNETSCIDLIGEKCHLPDHSLLFPTFKVGAQLNDGNISVVQTKRPPNIFFPLICVALHCWSLLDNSKHAKIHRIMLI